MKKMNEVNEFSIEMNDLILIFKFFRIKNKLVKNGQIQKKVRFQTF